MIAFFVPGIPAPQGSKQAFVRGKRAVLVEMSKALPAWRAAVTTAARAAHQGPPLDGPLAVWIAFYLPRPKSVPARRRPYPTVTPDLDKLARAVLDGITDARTWTDDARVVDLTLTKRYQDPAAEPGAHVRITSKEVPS